MTISTTSNRIAYTGNGVTTTFAFPYPYIISADLKVYVNSILMVLNVNYTIVDPDANPSTGTNIVFSSAPANAVSVVIFCDPDLLQSSDLPTNGSFPSQTVESMSDKLTLIAQRLKDALSRTLRLSDSSISTVSTVIPDPQGGYVIGWNPLGTGLINYLVSSAFPTIFPMSVTTIAALRLTTPLYSNQQFNVLCHTTVGYGGGVFYYDSTDTTSSDNNGTIIVNGTYRFKRINHNTTTPEMFGAIGNGANDDTATLQLCATSSRSITGTLGATYKVTDKINVPANTIMNGNGASITQATDQKAIFDVASVDSVKIYGFKFYGKTEASYVNSSTSLARAITGAAASNIILHDNYFENFYYSPVFITAGSKIAFCRNRVKGPAAILNTNTSYRNTTGATIIGDQILIADNEVYDTAQGFIVGEGSSNIIINRNSIHNTINEHGIYVDTSVNNLTITDNNIKTVAGNAIKVQNYTSFGGTCRNILISNNNITGVASFGGDAIIVYNSVPGGTPLYAFNVNISNNIIDSVAVGVGINVRYCKDVTVHKNIINNCTTSNAIYSLSCEKLRISGNIIDTTNRSSIYISSATGLTIENNEIRSPATAGFATDDYGIYIGTVDDLMIRNNQVYGLVATTKYCLYVAAGTQSTWSVYDNYLSGAEEYAVRFGSTSALLEYRNNYLSGVLGKSFSEPALTAVASAAALVLPTAQRVINITGTTTITSIDTSGHSGNIVTLVFAGILTVTRGSNVQIVSNFVTTSQDTLTICCDGNNWYEIGRAVN